MSSVCDVIIQCLQTGIENSYANLKFPDELSLQLLFKQWNLRTTGVVVTGKVVDGLVV